MASSKETKEILIAAIIIAKAVIPPLKDGFQPLQDMAAIASALVSSGALTAIMEAIKDVDKVWAEISSLDVESGSDLGIFLLEQIKTIGQLEAPAAE